MTLFLYKPHVTGAEGAVTSPDVIVDHVFRDGAAVPLTRLTTEAWVQITDDETARPGYAIIALGGGALLAPAVVLGDGTISVARQAWRLHTLAERQVALTLNGQPFAELAAPEALIEAAGGTGDALPRGYLLVHVSDQTNWRAVLGDAHTGRQNEHTLHPTPVSTDRWGADRPRPRYSVGPTQKEVTHYI